MNNYDNRYITPHLRSIDKICMTHVPTVRSVITFINKLEVGDSDNYFEINKILYGTKWEAGFTLHAKNYKNALQSKLNDKLYMSIHNGDLEPIHYITVDSVLKYYEDFLDDLKLLVKVTKDSEDANIRKVSQTVEKWIRIFGILEQKVQDKELVENVPNVAADVESVQAVSSFMN